MDYLLVESRLLTCVPVVAYPHCVNEIDTDTVKTLYIREGLTVVVNNFGPSKLLPGQIFLVFDISVHIYHGTWYYNITIYHNLLCIYLPSI